MPDSLVHDNWELFNNLRGSLGSFNFQHRAYVAMVPYHILECMDLQRKGKEKKKNRIVKLHSLAYYGTMIELIGSWDCVFGYQR